MIELLTSRDKRFLERIKGALVVTNILDPIWIYEGLIGHLSVEVNGGI
jgi:hypothetical protein